ncbi:hypothetical protein NQ317_008162 [Molorchus minor]|uniref:ZP domain-containing protein n=1 Tax=Molorchus minor TaxID=1323400 RepID=A0ABQ9JIT6_9CUCU|nr:hypothetical protein NQ317_008162 [Molorchus minor]
MKLHHILVAALATSFLDGLVLGEEGHGKKPARNSRLTRQTSADQMVQNILQWLQGLYAQQSRRSRFADYPKAHRPINSVFGKLDDALTGAVAAEGYPSPTTGPTGPGAPGYPTPSPDVPTQNTPGGFTGYPTAQPGYTSPSGTIGPPAETPSFPTRKPFPTQLPTTGYPTERPGFSTQPPGPGYSSGGPELSTQPPGPGYPSGRPESSTQPPGSGYPSGRPEFTTQPPGPGYLSGRPEFSTQPPGSTTGYPSERPEFSTQSPGLTTGYPSGRPEFSTQPAGEPGFSSQTPGGPTGYPTHQQTDFPTDSPVGTTTRYSPATDAPTQNPTTSVSVTVPPGEVFTSGTSPEPEPTTQSPESNTIPTEKPEKPGDTEPSISDEDDDSKHPPHIHAIDVECAKDMMTINIEFNREFNGVIYSKGYYSMPECRYVKENSAQTKYSFTVNLNQCGTEFINAFDTEGQSYLENILILQNELGIQEIWDTVRAVRCLWEGNLKETLSVALNVGMLTQELVTFSGDTAMAKLDVVLGEGALRATSRWFSQDWRANDAGRLSVRRSGFRHPGKGVQGDGFNGGQRYTAHRDENGGILKPKLFEVFQRRATRGDTGASIIAFAHFNAFKFPDVMDLMIECNIELCKTDCEMCTDPNQQIDPGRRKRDVYSSNDTLHDGIIMGKHLRIILPEDLNQRTMVDLAGNDGICMSTQSFLLSSVLLYYYGKIPHHVGRFVYTCLLPDPASLSPPPVNQPPGLIRHLRTK